MLEISRFNTNGPSALRTAARERGIPILSHILAESIFPISNPNIGYQLNSAHPNPNHHVMV
jgi:hypothetical protein